MRYQATPAAQRRLAERGFTRDTLPNIDGGAHVHIHTYDEEPIGSGWTVSISDSKSCASSPSA
jgi:hypothetical protein